ncbi:MAG: hypothetical protein NZ529_10865 [Cytophagaceae bacterium]|nr:hypothetical protein [Cytophagaceae bacterium]MDW8457286.1 hypothetical protein [Cytophagaceae bacterium]
MDTPRTIPTSLKISLFLSDVFFAIGLFSVFVAFIIWKVLSALVEVDYSSILFSPNKSATGTITQIVATNASENEKVIYEYHYEFQIPDTDTYKKGKSYYPGIIYKIGDQVIIDYDSKSGKSKIQNMRLNPIDVWLALTIFGVFTLLGFVFLFIGIKRALKNIDLLTNGVLTKAKVLRKEITNARINNHYVYKVYFQFKTFDGHDIEAMVRTHKPYVVEDEPEEMMVYRADNPQEAILLDALSTSLKKYF